MYISLYVTAGETDSASHSHHLPRVPIVLPHSVSFTNSETTLEPCQPRGRERMAAWDSGWKSRHIVPPKHWYLTHTGPAMFYIHRIFKNI